MRRSIFIPDSTLSVFYADALTMTRSDGSSSFPFFSLALFPSISLSSHLYLNTNGGLLKRNCPQNAGVPVVFHTQRACRTSHTCWKCVPRIIGACVSFPRLQVIIGLSGLHVAWCSTGSERCLWQQKRIQILKAALECLAHSTCWAVSSWTVIFILDPLIYFPVVESLWSAFFTGASF